MSTAFLRSTRTTLILAVFLASGGAYAQSQPSGSSNSATGQLKVGHVDHTKAMDGLLMAAQKLRESIQQMAQQEPGPKRDAAIDAAHDALLLTQRGMLKLPPELRVEDVKVREAKDWPKAMARLDAAAQTLRTSIDAMSKQTAGKGRDDA